MLPRDGYRVIGGRTTSLLLLGIGSSIVVGGKGSVARWRTAVLLQVRMHIATSYLLEFDRRRPIGWALSRAGLTSSVRWRATYGWEYKLGHHPDRTYIGHLVARLREGSGLASATVSRSV